MSPQREIQDAIASGDVTEMQTAFRKHHGSHVGGQAFDGRPEWMDEWENACDAYDQMPEAQGFETPCLHCGALLWVFSTTDPICNRCRHAWGED